MIGSPFGTRAEQRMPRCSDQAGDQARMP